MTGAAYSIGCVKHSARSVLRADFSREVGMNWIEVRLAGIDGEGVEVVWETLNTYAQGSPIIEQVRATDVSTDDVDAPLIVKAYLPDTLAGVEALQQLCEAIWHLSRLYPLPEPETRRLKEDDWATVWQKHYHRTRLGDRLVIAPAWDETPAEPDDIVVYLDPGMAFGTGQHPSTQLCLAFLEQVLTWGNRVYDVGAGSGILSIAAVKLGAGVVQAVDIDQVAVDAVIENAALNDVPCDSESTETGIQIRKGSIDTFDGPFDLIVINILAEVIADLLPAAAARLADGGTLVLAGIIAEREHIVQDAIRENQLRIVERRTQNDWVGLIVERST